jgi:hypothetical protein
LREKARELHTGKFREFFGRKVATVVFLLLIVIFFGEGRERCVRVLGGDLSLLNVSIVFVDLDWDVFEGLDCW